MKAKRLINKEILKILKDKEIPKDHIGKIIGKLTNYAYDRMIRGCPEVYADNDVYKDVEKEFVR